MIRTYSPIIAKNQVKYVNDCLESNMLTFHGKYVREFEEKLADYIGTKHCITTFNGSVSLFAILHCIKPQHYRPCIFTSSMTYVATVSQSILADYEPILIDCDSNFQMDLNKLEDACKTFSGVKILLLPQLYADTANMRDVIRLCDKYNLTLLEDSAETFGCRTMDKHLGTFGLAGSFSFFANKIITCGEGGCIVTDDDILAEKLRLFKNQANIGYYRHDGVGSNFRMTNIQAAIGLAQLEEIDFILEQKALTAAAYRAKISKKVQVVVPQNTKSSEWMPVFKLPDNVNYLDFDRHCKQNDIETRPGFIPVHLMDGFRQLNRTDLSMCESMVDRYFILPCGPTLTNAERNSIIKVVNSYFERK